MAKRKKAKKEYTLERPPVVTMLGHVDHGKTSILDAIRGTKVQTGEAGGITQNVRAHKIKHKTKSGETYSITFIDTPGHEAFSEMRSRGAKVTDIAILVVAADDGVQPQTKEAIKYIKKEKVPVVVALNKVDKKGINKAKVKRDLATCGIQVEKLGGEVMCVETSAKKKTGLTDLLEAILITAEMHQLKKSKPKSGIAEAVVLESTVDKSLGPISFCLVKAGEISVGRFVAWKDQSRKIRAVKDENLSDVEKASESDPVWIAGFDKLIPVGVTLNFFRDRQEVKEEKKKINAKKPSKGEGEEEELDEEILAQLLSNQKDERKRKLNLVLKAESQGTLEVVQTELKKLSSKDAQINILDSATGEITKDDIVKAKDVNGIVMGFRSSISKNTEKIAKGEKVLVRNYDIIYELLEEVAEVIESLREPEEKEVEIARVQIKKVFELSDGSKVAGCKVLKGTVVKGYQCFVERPSLKRNKRRGEGKIVSLKHGKEEIREAAKGTECGILIEPQIEIEKDDEIVCYKIEKV